MTKYNEVEDIYLDIDYLKRRLDNIKEVQSGQLMYELHKSNRENSNSVYIVFLQDIQAKSGVYYVFGRELRITDHLLDKRDWTQFLIRKGKVLTSGRKQAFREFLQCGIKSALKRINKKTKLIVELNLKKEKENEQSNYDGKC